MSKIKKGIPKEILSELDINNKDVKKPLEATVVVENHQAKISIPNKIRQKIKLPLGSTKCVIEYDELNKRIICQL